MGYLNLASLVLGLVAWVLPILALGKGKKRHDTKWFWLPLMSLTSCAVALFCQIRYQYYLVQIEDWGALQDTTGGVVLASSVLLVITAGLNALVAFKYYKQGGKTDKELSK